MSAPHPEQVLLSLLNLRALLTNEPAKLELCERLADAAADIWPEGPPAAPADLDDPDFLRVVERAIADMAP